MSEQNPPPVTPRPTSTKRPPCPNCGSTTWATIFTQKAEGAEGKWVSCSKCSGHQPKPNVDNPPQMQTYQGRMVNMLDIRPGDISIVDIAHALSLTNRYGGHSPFPLSVAQHSLMVSQVLPDEFKLWGLLHDGAEAYLGDIIHPLKVHLEVYQTFEQALMFIIAQRFGLVWPEPAEVKVADLAVGATECAQFGIPVNERREAYPIHGLEPIHETPWRVVKQDFLDEFKKLTRGKA